MPRPQSKSELQAVANQAYQRLNQLVATLTRKQQHMSFPFKHRDKNLRDVLAHLHHWHLMMLGWYEVGMSGVKPDMPAKGFTWKTTPQLNAEIWQHYQRTSLKQIRRKLNQSHEELCQLIDRHSNQELFQKRRYPWTGSTSLGAYLTSATSSHYEWAYKLIRKFQRQADN